AKRALQEGGLAGPGARHQVEREDGRRAEALAQGAGELVVLVEDPLAKLENARAHVLATSPVGAASESISRLSTNSSRPARRSALGVPQTEHRKPERSGSSTSRAQGAHQTAKGTERTESREFSSNVSRVTMS